MRPKGDDDACVVVANRGDVHRRESGDVDAGRHHRHRDSAAAGAQTGAGVLAVLIRRGAVVMRHRVPGMLGRVHLDRVAAVLGAMVEARRSQKGGLEPDGPDCGKGAEPDGATHHVQNYRSGGRRANTKNANDAGSRPFCGLSWRTGPDLGLEVGN